MRVAERKHHGVLALHLHAVPNANHIQLFLPAIGDTLDRIEHQGAGESVNSLLRVVLPFYRSECRSPLLS